MKEEIIKKWFKSWYDPKWNQFTDVFEDEIYYSESWGLEYNGIEEIIQWFYCWHMHSKLEKWEIKKILHIDDYSIVKCFFHVVVCLIKICLMEFHLYNGVKMER